MLRATRDLRMTAEAISKELKLSESGDEQHSGVSNSYRLADGAWFAWFASYAGFQGRPSEPL